MYENRKRLFEEIARKEGFEPLVAENWYKMTTYSMFPYRVCLIFISFHVLISIKLKGVKHVVKYYQNSYQRALMHFFPSLNLDPNKFGQSASILDKGRE